MGERVRGTGGEMSKTTTRKEVISKFSNQAKGMTIGSMLLYAECCLREVRRRGFAQGGQLDSAIVETARRYVEVTGDDSGEDVPSPSVPDPLYRPIE